MSNPGSSSNIETLQDHKAQSQKENSELKSVKEQLKNMLKTIEHKDCHINMNIKMEDLEKINARLRQDTEKHKQTIKELSQKIHELQMLNIGLVNKEKTLEKQL